MTNLTDKWEKDEIYKGTYYCKSKLDGHQCIASFVSNKGLFDCDYNGTLNKGYWEVLAEVPSYDEYLEMEGHCAAYSDINQWQKEEISAYKRLVAELKQENTKLKELLLECKERLIYCTISTQDVQAKINQVLGEE